MARFLDGIFGGGSGGIGPPGPSPSLPSGAGPARPTPQSRYFQDNSTGSLLAWRPMLREPAEDSRDAWIDATARSIEVLHNSGWLAGGVNLAVDFITGPELSLNARPDPDLMGGTQSASEWSRRAERRFAEWAGSAYACDLYGRQTLGQQCAQATKAWFATGEIAGVVRYVKRPGNSHGTKMQVVPAHRIPLHAQNMDAVQGLILDGDGFATGYVFTIVDPANHQTTKEIIVQARDSLGRKQVMHIHDSPATQLRGITPMAPALRVIRQFDQLANATLVNALIQAIFAATIQSAAPTPDILDALRGLDEGGDAGAPDGAVTSTAPESGWGLLMWARKLWYGNAQFDLRNLGKVIHLFSGEELKFHSSTTPNGNYRDFTRFLLREIAKCIGITYEQLTGDREGATYSSERMGGAEAWLTTLYRRKHIAGPFMQTAYEVWLEEEVEMFELTGGAEGMPFPGGLAGFLATRNAACKADWRGPPKPTADDFKTARANEVKLANKIITREMWGADEGVDWEDSMEQLKREQDRAAELGIDLTAPAPAQNLSSGANADSVAQNG